MKLAYYIVKYGISHLGKKLFLIFILSFVISHYHLDFKKLSS